MKVVVAIISTLIIAVGATFTIDENDFSARTFFCVIGVMGATAALINILARYF